MFDQLLILREEAETNAYTVYPCFDEDPLPIGFLFPSNPMTPESILNALRRGGLILEDKTHRAIYIGNDVSWIVEYEKGGESIPEFVLVGDIETDYQPSYWGRSTEELFSIDIFPNIDKEPHQNYTLNLKRYDPSTSVWESIPDKDYFSKQESRVHQDFVSAYTKARRIMKVLEGKGKNVMIDCISEMEAIMEMHHEEILKGCKSALRERMKNKE